MFDDSALSAMDFGTVVDHLNNQDQVLKRYKSDPVAHIVSGIDMANAFADVYTENAQLYRRLADIYDEWALRLRG